MNLTAEQMEQLTAEEQTKWGDILNEMEREVLFLRYVQQYTNAEIAGITGTTARNIRKHEEKALEMLRKAVGIVKDKKGDGNVGAVAKILGVVIFPTFVFGWWAANKIYPKLSKKR